MSETMELSRDTLETIGGYVKENLSTWMREIAVPPQTDPVLLERTVRVEEELKAQRELMKQGFEQMDKRFGETRADMNARFEQVDKRFAQVDKRFEQAHSHTNHWMTFMSIVLLALTVVVSFGIFFSG